MGQQIAPTDSYTCLSYERFSNIASPVGFSPANLLIKGQPCQEVSDAIDGVSTIAGLKVVVKKLARVVYWMAKNTET